MLGFLMLGESTQMEKKYVGKFLNLNLSAGIYILKVNEGFVDSAQKNIKS